MIDWRENARRWPMWCPRVYRVRADRHFTAEGVIMPPMTLRLRLIEQDNPDAPEASVTDILLALGRVAAEMEAELDRHWDLTDPYYLEAIIERVEIVAGWRERLDGMIAERDTNARAPPRSGHPDTPQT